MGDIVRDLSEDSILWVVSTRCWSRCLIAFMWGNGEKLKFRKSKENPLQRRGQDYSLNELKVDVFFASSLTLSSCNSICFGYFNKPGLSNLAAGSPKWLEWPQTSPIDLEWSYNFAYTLNKERKRQRTCSIHWNHFQYQFCQHVNLNRQQRHLNIFLRVQNESWIIDCVWHSH